MPCPALTVPFTPSQAPSRLHCPLGLSSGLFGSHCPSGPTSGAARPSVFPLAPPQALSGPHCPLSPCWAAQQPIQGSPSPPASFGRCIPSSRPSASLIVIPDSAFLLLSAPSAGHSLLLEQHHVASRLGGCPLPARFPAAALPVARPGPTACAPSSWSALSPTLSLRSPRRLLRPGLAASRAAADAARSSGSAAPRGGGASLRQPERHTQWCALTSARRRSLVGLVPSRP